MASRFDLTTIPLEMIPPGILFQAMVFSRNAAGYRRGSPWLPCLITETQNNATWGKPRVTLVPPSLTRSNRHVSSSSWQILYAKLLFHYSLFYIHNHRSSLSWSSRRFIQISDRIHPGLICFTGYRGISADNYQSHVLHVGRAKRRRSNFCDRFQSNYDPLNGRQLGKRQGGGGCNCAAPLVRPVAANTTVALRTRAF